MDKFNKIIFVSMDDTSTSPMAEAICKSLVHEEEWDISSRGLVVLFSEPINPKVCDMLKNNNISGIKENSQAFDESEVTPDTLVLVMNAREKNTLLNDYSVDKDRVYILSEYVDEFSEITDPYGENIAGYERCYCELIRMVKKLVYKLS